MPWSYKDAEEAEWIGTLKSNNIISMNNLTAGKLNIGNMTSLDTGQDVLIIQSNTNTMGTGFVGLTIENKGSGDTGLTLRMAAKKLYQYVDNSDSDIFKISYSSQLETGLQMESSSNSIAIGGTPVNNAKLAVVSTVMAFLPPVMTSAQMGAIQGPTAGMMVYNSTSGAMYYFTSGSLWRQLATGM